MNAAKQSTEQAVLEALVARPEVTAAEIAAVTRRGRSTVARTLAKLEKADKVTRISGERNGSRRPPYRWRATGERRAPSKTAAAGQRLRSGQLDGLVLDYLRKHAAANPMSPATVAKGLERSSGAVANCLVRLARGKQVRQVSKTPRRYSLPTKGGKRTRRQTRS